MKRRDFIGNTTISLTAFQLIHANASFQEFISFISKPFNNSETFELNEMSIKSLQELMKTGKLTSEKITKLYLHRIEEIDKKGPAINAIIELNPEAIAIAKRLDDERNAGKIRGPLHGIPILIKDNIDTGDQMMTTAGSLALMNHKASNDAFIVKKLRDAGAVILGKTNLSEWANFRSTRSSSGWSSRGGQTKNPYVLDRSPCGSSSGSGASVAANLCAVAVGTETDGSIACPASMNGIVGIKPTVGLVSRTGIIPISKTQDTAGPMARSVEDAVILLNALAGKDVADPGIFDKQLSEIPDYTTFLDIDGLKGKRIGVEKSFLHKHEAVDALLMTALNQMRHKGAEIIELEFIKPFNKIAEDEFKLLEYEFKSGLNKYLFNAKAEVKSLNDIIQFNKNHESSVMPYFKQEIMDSSQTKLNLNEPEYLNITIKYREARSFYNKFLIENKLDAFCGPANGFAWYTDLINGDFYTGYGTYGPAAVCGFPSITVPMGQFDNLPVGISFISNAYSEPQLISIAYAYEQVSKNRKPPEFKLH